MPEIHCHVPLTIRLTGEVHDDLWASLEDALTTRYTRIVRRSLDDLARRRSAPKQSAEPVRERFQASRARTADVTYSIPGYQDGGAPTPLPMQAAPGAATVTPEAVARLTNEEIDRRIQAALDRLRTLVAGTPEHQAARDGLTQLEEEADSRGYDSPALIRDALLRSAAALLAAFAAVDAQIALLFAPAPRNNGAIDLFKKRFAARGPRQSQWIRAALLDAIQRARAAPKDDLNAAFDAFGAAGTRLIAASFGAQLLGAWVAFLQLADAVLRQVPFYSIEHLLVVIDRLWPRLEKPLEELSSLDAARVQAAVAAAPVLVEQLVAEHTSLLSEIETAVKSGQAFMLAAAIAETLASLASLRITLPPRTPGPPAVAIAVVAGGVTQSGALVGGRLVISVDWIEMIRRLLAAGVIAAPVAAAGVRAGIFMMAASTAPPGAPPVVTGTDVVSSGTGALQPGKSALGQYGIDAYKTFANRPADRFAGHELLQNLWLQVKELGRRRVGAASRENPAMALTHAEHAEVWRQQYARGLFDRQKLARMSAAQVIEENALAMRQANIPEFAIEALKREALRHAATLKIPPVGVP